MGVPAEIRSVPRPKNTVVVDTGSNGGKRYAVRERAGTKYVPGGNPQPRNGKIIGYIIDGKYCPREEPPEEKPVEAQPQPLPQTKYLSYGVPALLQPLSQDLLAQLTAVYGPEDAESLLSYASLAVEHNYVSRIRSKYFEENLQAYYEASFLRSYYPRANLSRRGVSKLFQRLHTDTRSRQLWNAVRLNTVPAGDHIVLCKGYFTVRSPKKPDSPLTTMIQDVTVLYAYSLKQLVPLCLQVFPGKEPSETAFRAFLQDNDIRDGILLVDQDFPADRLHDLLADHPELHFIVKHNLEDPLVSSYHMLEFQDQVLDFDEEVQYRKAAIPGGHTLYAFHDISLDEEEEDEDEYVYYPPVESSHVHESDLDLSPDTLFQLLLSQHHMEAVLNYHHTRTCVPATPSRMGHAVSGNTFVDFLGSILQDRMLDKANDLDLLEDYPDSELVDALRLTVRQADAPPPTDRDDPYWLRGMPYDFPLLEKLGIVPTKKRKRGRPPKNPTPQA